MRSRLFVPIYRGVQTHPYYYAFWSFVLITGIVCGFHTITLLYKTNPDAIQGSLNAFLQPYVYHERSLFELFLSSLISNGCFLLLLVLAGLFRFGSLFLYAVPALKGFSMGSLLGMLSACHGLGGFLSGFVILLVSNALMIVCLLHAGSFALTQIQSNHRLKFNRNYLFPAFIFFAAAVIMDCSIVPLIVGLLGSAYV